MIVPYTPSHTIDYDTQEALIEFYLTGGCGGLFTLCLSTEMYDLTNDERLSLAKFVVQKARGRVPVYACGTFGETVEEMSSFSISLHKDCGVSAVVVLCSMMAEEGEDEIVWRQNVEKYLSLMPKEIPLGTYECPLPYHRLLSPGMLGWVAAEGRFVFHKDTCCASDVIREKLKVK